MASFFLSRIDTIIDLKLQESSSSNLKGKVAVACAKKAYEIYKGFFLGDRFKKLEAKGAQHQRVLWASNSTKDATFSDVKYVESLIGPEIINTITLETLNVFRDHGRSENRL